MLWAVRRSDPTRFVHVGLLEPSENGAACACLCRGCGEGLLAVNVSKPPEHFTRRGAQRKHFKHRSVNAAEARCLRRVAQLLALQLFVEQELVYLPQRPRLAQRNLPNGAPVMADLSSVAERVGVMRRTWIDDWSAVLLLEDGRELTVTVRTQQTFDAVGGATCVLSLAGVCDPMIASWGKEEILEHLRAPNNGLVWTRHWEDAQRQAQIDEALTRQQADLLGDIPPEWLQGLTGKQFNETILHYLIKKAVAERGSILVPAYRSTVTRTMPDGEVVQVLATWPACTLVLDEVRLEKRLGNMVPDVMCRAWPSNTPKLSFDLMIEGAVTHLVDAEKAAKIRAAGVACIEIVARNFDRAGQIPAREIEELVCSSTSAKQWICLPMAHKSAERQLDDKAAAVKRRIAEERHQHDLEARERARQERTERQETQMVDQWIANSSDEILVKGYLKILMKLWSGDTSFSQGHKASHHHSVVHALRERQVLTEPISRVESPYGILRKLVLAYQCSWEAYGVMSLDNLAAAIRGGEDSSYAVDLIVALASRRAEMNPTQRQAYDASCAAVRREVEAENPRFQRDAKRQRLHALVIPALAETKKGDFGSISHYARMKQKRLDNERRVSVRIQRLDRVKSGRILQTKAAEARGIASAIEDESRRIHWRSFVFEEPSSVALLARYSQNRPADLRFVNLSAQELLSTAERYRRSSATVATALAAMNFTVAADVPTAARALVLSGLCVSAQM